MDVIRGERETGHKLGKRYKVIKIKILLWMRSSLNCLLEIYKYLLKQCKIVNITSESEMIMKIPEIKTADWQSGKEKSCRVMFMRCT